ncbi:hypothetical protein B0H19DRAFT_1258064 [Mycena capillaripes]|nr:hypothetical protein B0H19DRAFT_1258064 [Mycena capillaripes]
MQFYGLDMDVLLRILALTDVSTIMSFSRVPRDHHILILEVDLITGDSEILSHLRTATWPRYHVTILINWCTAECIIFDSELFKCCALFPGHFILAYAPESSRMTLNLHLYSISSFGNLWRPVSNLDSGTPTDIEGIPFLGFSLGGASHSS